jgi:hypothetical protein
MPAAVAAVVRRKLRLENVDLFISYKVYSFYKEQCENINTFTLSIYNFSFDLYLHVLFYDPILFESLESIVY